MSSKEFTLTGGCMRFRIEVVSFKPSSSKSRNGRLQEQVREVIKMRPNCQICSLLG